MLLKLHNFFAAMMLFCYLLAVEGVDVHHCDDNGKSYLALPVLGLSCESVHPDEECSKECHGDDDDCCSDTVYYITISGDGFESAASTVPLFSKLVADVIRPILENTIPLTWNVSITYDVSAPPGTILKNSCVLRV